MPTVKMKMAKLGMSMEEAKIIEWHVTDGAEVKAGEELYSVETDKSTMDVESPFEGRIKIIGQAGETFKIGEIIAEFDI